MTLHRSDEAGRDLNAGERSQEAPPPRTAAFQNHRIHAAFQKTILAQHALSTSRHGKSTITLSEQFHFIANRSLPVLLFSNSDRKLRIGHFQLPIHGVGIENGLAQRYTDHYTSISASTFLESHQSLHSTVDWETIIHTLCTS